MKKHLFSFLLTLSFSVVTLFAQRGYYDTPYEHYEADSGKVCVDMSAESTRGKIIIYG